MSKCFFLLLPFIFVQVKAYSQNKFHLTGTVVDIETNLPLHEATVAIDSSRIRIQAGTGFKIELSGRQYEIVITHLGYDTLRMQMDITRSLPVTFKLTPRSEFISEVRVTARGDEIVTSIQSNTISLNQKDVTALPGFLGESDPLRAIQAQPGVGNGGEGNSGFFVRGGTAGQNQILLNDALVYNPSHLLGFFSVFNSNVVDRIKLIKSGIPAEYGGRVSSVLEAQSDRKIPDSLSIKASMSLLSGNTALSIPITPRWSITASGRKTFLGLMVWPLLNGLKLNSKFLDRTNYDFYDVNLTSNIRLGTKDYFHISLYNGGDDFFFNLNQFNVSNNMNWHNTAASVNWKKIINNSLTLTNVISFSNYDFNFGLSQDSYKASIASAVRDFNYKGFFSYHVGNHQIKAGIQHTTHRFKPNTPFAVSAGTLLDLGTPFIYNIDETSLFGGDELALTDRLGFYAGVRLTRYQHRGPYAISKAGTSEKIYTNKEVISSRSFVEPRFLVRYLINENSSLKFSLTHNIQPVHLVSLTSVNFPTDFWMPSVGNVPVQKGNQLSAGYFRHSGNHMFESYFDVFYKEMNGLVEFSGGLMNLLDNLKIEDHLLVGKGSAYGGEFYLKKKDGRLTGSIGYTLAWSNRRFAEIENGSSFPDKYDRRHDLSFVSSYSMDSRWRFSLFYTYASGFAYTKPVSRYMIGGNIINEYGKYNSSRMPDYHRMDVSGTYTLKSKRKAKNELTFAVYNVYSRQNPIYSYHSAEGDLENFKVTIKEKSISLLPVLPSISWSYRF